MANIDKHGFWKGESIKCEHAHDPKLSKALVKFMKYENVESIVDLGCGLGNYVRYFIENGINAEGYDGNPDTGLLTNHLCKVTDLSQPVNFVKPFSWVLSLEVGEHIPKKFENTFINNLHLNNVKGIILSWAIKGQRGYGHVNTQNNNYIKDKICKLGYINDIKIEKKLRKKSKLKWFKKTIMVFRKKI